MEALSKNKPKRNAEPSERACNTHTHTQTQNNSLIMNNTSITVMSNSNDFFCWLLQANCS